MSDLTFGLSLAGSTAVGGALYYMLEQGVLKNPVAPAEDGSTIPNSQLAAAGGALAFLVFFVSCLFVIRPSASVQGNDKKKKKKGGKSGGNKASTMAKKPAAKQEVKQEAKQEVPQPSKKGKKGKGKDKAGPVPTNKAPAKPKSPKKPKMETGEILSNKWAALNDSDDDDDAYVPNTTKKGPKTYEDDSDDDFSVNASSKTEKLSKAALRRRRQGPNKGAEQPKSSTSIKQPQNDDDGWTTHTVKKRVKKAPVADVYGDAEKKGIAMVSTDVKLTVNVPYEKYGLLIGPKGATLMKLQDATKTRIDVPKQDNPGPVTITGPAEGANKCKSAIQSLVKQGFSSITDPGMSSASINVPPRALGIVIGPKGANIKSLQEQLGVRINTPDRGSESNKVTISGEKESVARAREAIKSLMDDGFSSVTHPTFVKEYVDFPPNEYPTLIGPGGHTIKSIQGDTKCKVNIPDANSEEERVCVVGAKADVARAIVQINRLLDEEYQAARAAKLAAKHGVTVRGGPDGDDDDPYDW